MTLVVLQNHCFGMGDAVSYCWVYHTLKGAGLNVLVNPVRHHEIFRMFGVPECDWTEVPDDRPSDPRKGEGGRGWIRNWVKEWSGLELDPARPPYLESPADGEWADGAWAGRDRDVGSRRRVLVFPEVVYASRDWGKLHWAALCRQLMKEGFNVITVTQKYDPDHPYPWCQGGHSQRQIAALCARADVVLGNDSGPAHVAGTVGVKTLAVCGPSPVGWFFEHMGNVEELRVTEAEVGCVGCNWDYDHGRKFTGLCSKGCAALASYSPLRVISRVKELFNGSESGKAVLVDLGTGCRPGTPGLVFDHDERTNWSKEALGL